MNEDQRKLCRALVILPNGSRRIAKEDFVHQFPSAIENDKLAARWLEEAYNAQNAEDLEYAFIIGGAFGFAPVHKGILCCLAAENWHHSHEAVVTALQTWPTSDTVDSLFLATQWIPKYLEYDDFRALAVKAIWALGKIPGPEAQVKLELLAGSDNAIISKNAMQQLERRRIPV